MIGDTPLSLSKLRVVGQFAGEVYFFVTRYPGSVTKKRPLLQTDPLPEALKEKGECPLSSPMLRCTVRGCFLPLTAEAATLRCPNGHAFDRARPGYWNLLQPQDRRSHRAGDRPEAVAARRRWLQHGFVDGLVTVLSAEVGRLGLREGDRIADV